MTKTKPRTMLAGLVAAAAIAVAAVGTPAHAELKITLDSGVVEPIPIAVVDFLGAGAQQQTAAQIATVVRGDLERSGLFRPLDPHSFIEKIATFEALPRFGDWRTIQAQALVTGQASVLPDGKLKVDFRLWDIFGEQQMVGLTFSTTAENWRRLGHLIADAIYERLTGEKGYFDTRIVFIAESGPKTKRRYRLSIMDQDGANPSFLTGGDYIVLSPRFSPTQQAITYMSYEKQMPSVFVFDLQTGQREVVRLSMVQSASKFMV